MMPSRACELNSFIVLVGQHFNTNHVAVAKVVLVSEFDFAGDFDDVPIVRVFAVLGSVGAEDDGALVEDAAGDYIDVDGAAVLFAFEAKGAGRYAVPLFE
jgi:hypothetical protein